jgi:hypothetical protein
MSSSASNEAYNTLIKLWDKLTCLNGMITLEAINKLKDKLGGIFTVAKTQHYAQGQKYRHLASAILKNKYRLGIGNATWTHMVPTNPEAYSADALNAGNAAAMCKQFVALHKSSKKVTGITRTLKRQGRNSSFMQLAIMQLPSRSNISALATRRY